MKLRNTTIILGPMTSGKSTTARALVKEGLKDGMVETDEFLIWTAGWNPWTGNPSESEIKEFNSKKNRYAGKAVAALSSLGSVVVSGVWPGAELSHMLSSIRDYDALVLWIDMEEARQRWIDRGSEEDMPWDSCIWGSPEWWTEFEEKFKQLAADFSRRGRLIEDVSEIRDLCGLTIRNIRGDGTIATYDEKENSALTPASEEVTQGEEQSLNSEPIEASGGVSHES